MNLSFTWINLLILFGAFQALVFSMVLLFQRGQGRKFLALFVFVFAFNGIETFNWSAGLNHVFFDLSSFVIIFAAGPALYLYIKSVFLPQHAIPARDVFVHFSLLIFQSATRLSAIGCHLLFINKVISTESYFLDMLSFTWTYAESVSMLAFLAYVIASVRLYQKTTASNLIQFPSKVKGKSEVMWVRSLLICSLIIAVAWAVTLLFPLIFSMEGPNYYPVELMLVGFTYWLVLHGYHKTKEIHSQKRETDLMQSIPEHQSKVYLQKLVSAMSERKLYLDPKMTLSKLSRETGVPEKIISAVLNQGQQSNFNDFVNSYRIKEVCRKLLDSNITQRYTISAIAFECGFNSQATFQRVFKSKTGMSPREYVSLRVKESA